MAKFTVEVDLDWIGEEGNIDEEVENRILSRIEAKALEKLMTVIDKDSKARVEVAVDAQIGATLKEKIETLLAMPRTITDDYGRTTQEGVTLDHMLTARMEKMMSGIKVLDKDGQWTGEGYRAEFSVLEFFASKNLSKIVQARVAALAAQTKKDIEIQVADKIRTQVADKLTQMIMDNSSALALKS
jgi:hypothetical protein